MNTNLNTARRWAAWLLEGLIAFLILALAGLYSFRLLLHLFAG